MVILQFMLFFGLFYYIIIQMCEIMNIYYKQTIYIFLLIIENTFKTYMRKGMFVFKYIYIFTSQKGSAKWF